VFEGPRDRFRVCHLDGVVEFPGEAPRNSRNTGSNVITAIEAVE